MKRNDNFYEEKIRGKGLEKLLALIKRLYGEIAKQKRIAEDPSCDLERRWDACKRIDLVRERIEATKGELASIGGEYAPTKNECRCDKFNQNLMKLKKIEMSLISFCGMNEYTVDFDGDGAVLRADGGSYPEADHQEKTIDKKKLISDLKKLNIGEWRKRYDASRYNFFILDGVEWKLRFVYDTGINSVKICGANAFPYNFDKLLKALKIDGWNLYE